MATNQMRRDAAKRKLANQQARRAQQAARRRRVAVISAASVVALVLVGIVALSTLGGGSDEPAAPAASPDPSAAPPAAATPAAIPTEAVALPARSTPLPATVSCDYPTGGDAAKPVNPPPAAGVPAEGTVGATLQTSAGPVPMTLDRALAPCTVNNFVSLAEQGYYAGTRCHRLTVDAGLQVLQCGDPTGTGSGGPGYTIPDEVFPELTYGRGLLAMAKTAAPDSGGSQFFMVYGDAELPPEYTVFGSIAPEGLQVVDGIARAGTDEANGPGDGAPVAPVTIESVAVS